MEKIRELIFYKHYFKTFVESLPLVARTKIDRVLFLLTHIERVPEKFLKHIEGQKGLYELRIKAGSNIYRIFCCFDRGKIVILLNAFQKKTQKTPPAEIATAIKLMNEYFNNR
ncbi:Phage derived protein Gp49-like [Dyadobacter sp. SG02]|uniref:type II toxin-antitoxin system RelE/ParE family toxin n=1 Tax=Dyadobacter sp. SG02 TaxID=1855291 RepID=UPI0008AC33D1|nr:type II toxin-antitoxin system RelE/ParE family toxin [Dyadobacter sp. SG02]SEI46096.1 Phage derived protein Gp49-like [Dyadobacter sp. SG02]